MSTLEKLFDAPKAAAMPIPHEMNLDEAISEIIRIDGLYAELKELKRKALDVVLPEAIETRGQQKTIHLTNHRGQKLKVEFKTIHKCDVDQLNVAREMLGDDQFENLFKTEYSPRLRALKMFMSTKSTDERIETAKGEIRAGWQEVEGSAYVSVEKQ